MNIILFGPPGAGKGTQADNLVNEFDLFNVSTGNLLRNEVENNTTSGVKIKSIINRGELAPDVIINDLIKNIISNKKYFNRMIFDGYPRNLNQVEYLNNSMKFYNQKISCVLNLKVDRNIIIKRIIGRQICSECGLTFNEFFNPATNHNHKCGSNSLKKRSDDNEKTAKNRYETYTKETLPIFDYYKNQKLLYEIDGKNDIELIYKEISQIIHSLVT